jgi:hypothetical protein
MLAMKPYSEDLRKKIVAALERGMPKTEAACGGPRRAPTRR